MLFERPCSLNLNIVGTELQSCELCEYQQREEKFRPVCSNPVRHISPDTLGKFCLQILEV